MSFKATVRDLGYAVAPRTMAALTSWRSQRIVMRSERRSGKVARSQEFCATHGATVHSGPFKGMVYPASTARQRNLIPKLLGSYEDEIYEELEGLLARPQRSVVNVGSADGFYSVGIAMRLPETPVIAFDTDIWARNATRALARQNNVSNIDIRFMCDVEWLARDLAPNSLVLMDCEGCEMTLLDPRRAPLLANADILVEMHEHRVAGVDMVVSERFKETHEIRVVTSRAKDPTAHPLLADVDQMVAKHILSEGRRSGQSWFIMRAKRDLS